MTLETVGPGVAGVWAFRSFRVTDHVGLTDQLRLRFTVSDFGATHVIEAGVDGVALYNTATGIFDDGFETGDTSRWSLTVP